MIIVVCNNSNSEVTIMRPVYGNNVILKPHSKVAVEARAVDLPYYRDDFKVFGVTAYEKPAKTKVVLNEEVHEEQKSEEEPKPKAKSTKRKTITL